MISIAYEQAVRAVGETNGTKPLPKGLSSARIGDWQITVNNGKEALEVEGSSEKLPGFSVLVDNQVYFGLGIFSPIGGFIGGLSENRLIADLTDAGFAPLDEGEQQ